MQVHLLEGLRQGGGLLQDGDRVQHVPRPAAADAPDDRGRLEGTLRKRWDRNEVSSDDIELLIFRSRYITG